MTSVLLVDDQDLIRGGFRLILERAGIRVVGEAGTGQEAVALATTRRILAAGLEPAPHIIVLTTFDTDEYVYGAIRAGASGFLLKDCTPASLINAVGSVLAGETMLAPRLTQRLLEQFVARSPVLAPEVKRLSEREQAVTRLIAKGMPNQEIGAELFLSEATPFPPAR